MYFFQYFKVQNKFVTNQFASKRAALGNIGPRSSQYVNDQGPIFHSTVPRKEVSKWFIIWHYYLLLVKKKENYSEVKRYSWKRAQNCYSSQTMTQNNYDLENNNLRNVLSRCRLDTSLFLFLLTHFGNFVTIGSVELVEQHYVNFDDCRTAEQWWTYNLLCKFWRLWDCRGQFWKLNI